MNELAYFTDSVNKLIDGKLILVDKNIASVLRCVAAVPALRKCLADTVRSVSYVTEFSRARVTWTRPDGTVEARLKLPAERNRIFSFVVCLLTEVDSGRRNFLEFLREYYDDKDNNAAYEKFAEQALRPFKRAGESILQTVDPESLNTEWVMRAERYFNVEKTYIPTNVLGELLNCVQQVAAEFYSAGETALRHYEDVMNCCECFTHALYLKNPRIILPSWLALRGIMEQYPFAQELLQKMTALMQHVSIN